MEHISTGHWIFALLFLIVFIFGINWAYKKDRTTNRIHFKGSSKIIAVIVLVFFALYLFVKIKV